MLDRTIFEWAVRVWPTNANTGIGTSGVGFLWQTWARMEQQEGNLELALNYVARAVHDDSRDWQAWLVWASLERTRGDNARCGARARWILHQRRC